MASAWPAVRTAGAAAVLILYANCAMAFPLLDPSNLDSVPSSVAPSSASPSGAVPSGTELSAPDTQDLQHQLRMVNGLAPPTGGGWTFVPKLDLQEMLTDNVLQVNSPRRWDMVSYVAPGLGIAGETPKVTLNFNIQPTLAMYARTSSLNSLTDQFEGTGLITLVDDLAYVDLRAVSGVHSQIGGIGGVGSIGASGFGGAGAGGAPSLGGNSLGLNKSNEIQTENFGVSPYLLRRFGDWGTGKLGYSLNVARSDTVTGFASSPIASGGANSQTLISNEEIAHFDTGDFLGATQNSVDVDLLQTQTTTGASYTNGTASDGVPPNNANFTNTRAYVKDTISYVVNRTVTVFGSGGHENINYGSQQGIRPIDDMTWSFGTTLTPSPDSSLTVSYGHLNGYNSLSANGYYALTARTSFNLSYSSTVGTQLENLQSQLNLAASSPNGGLVNGQTGGQVFGNVNTLGAQNGVFQYNTLTVGMRSNLDRDIISVNLFLTKQIQQGTGTGSDSTAKTFSVVWTHQIWPDLTLNTAVNYALTDQPAGTGSGVGNSNSLAATTSLLYQVTPSLAASLRYSLLDRRSTNAIYNVYQNLLILGVSKSF